MEGEEGGLERQRRAPLVLEDVQADGAVGAANVGVPDLGDETHLGRDKGVLVIQVDVHIEDAAVVGGVLGPCTEGVGGGRWGAREARRQNSMISYLWCMLSSINRLKIRTAEAPYELLDRGALELDRHP